MHSNPLPNLQHEAQQHQVGGPDKYLITRERLAEIVQTNGTDAVGIENIVSALRTNLDEGIKGDERDLRCRREAFGRNFRLQGRSPQTIKCIMHLLLNALRDTTILLLLCCAILSLAIGLKTNGAAQGAIDGALFLLTVSFVVGFGAIVGFLRSRWAMRKSLMRSHDVWVVRNGLLYVILESELVVGDIVCLQTGDRVPADGIFFDGDDVFQLYSNDHLEEIKNSVKRYPSMFTGAKVVSGRCCMVVALVGDNTERSMLIRSIGLSQTDRLQLLDAIEKTNSKFDKIWLSLSLILLVVQFVRCFVSKRVGADKDRSMDPKGVKNRMEDLMKESMQVMKKERMKANGLVTMLLVLLFASREGLPLAVFVSLLYASNRMKSCKAIVRQLQASATVGLITTVCTCKTADLALQHAKMADLWIGLDLVHDHDHDNMQQVNGKVLDALRQGILVHTPSLGNAEEISLVAWARAVLGLNMEFRQDPSSMVRYEIDGNLCCSIVERERVDEEEEDKVVRHVHWRGAPEFILSMCSHYYTVDGKFENLDTNKTTAFNQIVQDLLAGCGQCCFAFAYKREIVEEEEGDDDDDRESDLTLLGFVCLKNPYSPQVIEAIEECRKSGVEVKLMVDDDINTARIMAFHSGLVRPEHDDDGGGAIVEGGDFRRSSEAERMNMVDKIVVMANASPADKMLMVQCLRQKRHVVAAAAAALRDSPLLNQADVGIFMGGEWTEMSKEDGDVMVPTNNLSEIPKIVNLGRRVCRNLEKFIELQLTMEISTFTINIISLAATSQEALTTFQVLWINLAMDILGAAAVAVTTIDTRSPETMAGDPVYGSGRIITRAMWRSIAVQSVFQVGVILTMMMKGKTVFEVNESELGTMIFNCYALCQVFQLIPAVELRRDGVVSSANLLFVGFVAVIGILQVAVVEIVGAVAHRRRLDLKRWCICIGISSLSLPLNCGVNWRRISRL